MFINGANFQPFYRTTGSKYGHFLCNKINKKQKTKKKNNKKTVNHLNLTACILFFSVHDVNAVGFNSVILQTVNFKAFLDFIMLIDCNSVFATLFFSWGMFTQL